MLRSFKLPFLLLIIVYGSHVDTIVAQAKAIPKQMAATVMARTPPAKWTYDEGVILEGMEAFWMRTGNGDYFKYIQKSIDPLIAEDGTIITYSAKAQSLDNIKTGRSLLTLYKVTGQMKYFKAATLLWEQLQQQPRTSEGGFWHKQIYPDQMWLDGLYMAEPFYAEYAALIKDDKAFDDIANQFILMEKHSRDNKTGLLYHGWDASGKQRWADPKTGHSPEFWGRAMGWYAMALVDVLDNFPALNPKRQELLAILSRLAKAIQLSQDPQSGLWYDILDKPKAEGNYKEASVSCMFVYALQKGVRLSYLPSGYAALAKKGYEGIKKEFIEDAGADQVNLKGTVSVSGLGGTPYRDGSYGYYIHEKVVTNDAKGVGAFLLATNEMVLADWTHPGRDKTVMLDYFFNSETKKDQSGHVVQWHYKWDEWDNGGYSMWGELFKHEGFRLKSLPVAPTLANLKSSSVYIITDPDIEKENPKPNFISAADVANITQWVKNGGVLVLMANDTGNAELDHFNQLATNFGIRFNKDSKGKVTGRQFEMAKLVIPPADPFFKNTRQIYVKEYSSLQLTAPASSVLKDKDGNVVIAISKLGKGSIFAIGDPWLYNEYTDGRKLPAEYDNFDAAADLIQWISEQIR
ncbi:glycoside hydrolase family 88 protein [Pedobacter sp. L105]|uniref:glycoside hydrolase family 88 protein n=1 Tax=Pedobacter sp. L105 TaxID=1641871 RepID=UPI00131B3C70|nr:DUF4350 domain-containing protein [Pedobacter sp. L105]